MKSRNMIKNEYEGRIDLHIHSNNSDADSTIEEIIQNAEAEGLSLIFITDHNNTAIRSTRKLNLHKKLSYVRLLRVLGCQKPESELARKYNIYKYAIFF